jgi:hypothetical protein
MPPMQTCDCEHSTPSSQLGPWVLLPVLQAPMTAASTATATPVRDMAKTYHLGPPTLPPPRAFYCQQPISVCSSGGVIDGLGCPQIDWVAAQKICAGYSPTLTSNLGGTTQLFLLACAEYDVLFEEYPVEGTSSAYYDRTNGSLVAVVAKGNSIFCLGPSCFVEPSDCRDLSPCPPLGDAGVGDDADTDGG